MSHLRSVQHHPAEKRDVVLIYTVNSLADFGLREELVELCAVDGVRLIVLCPEDPQVREYLGEGYPSSEQLRQAVADISTRRVYASGSPTFIAHAVHAGHQAGARKVHTDRFLGY